MPFQLIIRNNLKHDADSFTGSELGVFEQETARIGSSDECDCQVLDQEGRGGDEVWFEIEQRRRDFFLHRRAADLEIYINHQLTLGPTTPLTSGDTIRVGHWTFRLQRLSDRARAVVRADWSASLSKALIATLILLQLVIALWLPGQLNYAQIVPDKIIEQETIILLDHTRRHAATFPRQSLEREVDRAAWRLVSAELDRIAAYMRRHQPSITPYHWQQINRDLSMYRDMLDQISDQELVPNPPPPAIDQAVQALVRATAYSINDNLSQSRQPMKDNP